MVRSNVRVQIIAVLIGDVQERTCPIVGMEVSSAICTINEGSFVEAVIEQIVPIKETKLVSKDLVVLGSLLVVFADDEEVVPKVDEKVPIVFRAERCGDLVVDLLGEDVNIEVDIVKVYCSDQLVHLYGIVDVVVVYGAKEIRKNSIKIRLGRKQ